VVASSRSAVAAAAARSALAAKQTPGDRYATKVGRELAYIGGRCALDSLRVLSIVVDDDPGLRSSVVQFRNTKSFS
jgi:hypothetical protein